MQCTTVAAEQATPPFSLLPTDLCRRLFPLLAAVVRLIVRHRGSQWTPQSAFDFEHELSGLLRDLGRQIVEWTFNDAESASPDLLPRQIRIGDAWYQRCHAKTANRHVATLFGVITLMRFGYRPIEELVPCVFPLEIRLGLEAARATPALADRAGQYMAECTQQATLKILRRDHGVGWSVHLLRKVTAAVAAGMSDHRHAAHVAKLLDLLKMAEKSRGIHRPILSVGRDGIFVPTRNGVRRAGPDYREGAVATLSVMDRRGKRLGTVYLARMPEEEQITLSQQLTSLITDVLKGWSGALPRLVYVTDAGYHQTRYFKRVLRQMRNPRSPGQRLKWEWVLDYYHACQYVSKLAEALFGEGREAQAWAAKMRRWLKEKPRGIHRVLHSAAAFRERRGLSGLEPAYDKAYDYLRRRIRRLDYHGYRKRRMPIGSGVTEACCKTVFTQRLKQSGMSWNIESGQVIVDLRTVHLSGTWEAVRTAYLQSKADESMRTQTQARHDRARNAA